MEAEVIPGMTMLSPHKKPQKVYQPKVGSTATAVKVCVICGLVLVTNPVGAHAIAKGAYQAGIRPRKKMEIEDYRRDFNE